SIRGIRSVSDLRFLGRIFSVWLILFGVGVAATLSAEVFRPAPLVAGFIFMLPATGFLGAFRTGLIRAGVAAALSASLVFFGLMIVVFFLRPDLPHPPIAGSPILPISSAVLAMIGALFGKHFRGMFGRPLPSGAALQLF